MAVKAVKAVKAKEKVLSARQRALAAKKEEEASPVFFLNQICKEWMQTPCIVIQLAKDGKNTLGEVFKTTAKKAGFKLKDFDDEVIGEATKLAQERGAIPKTNGVPSPPKTVRTQLGEQRVPQRAILWGQPLGSVIRALARIGTAEGDSRPKWTRGEVQKALWGMGFVGEKETPYKTIDTQLHNGRRTNQPAPILTEEQIREFQFALQKWMRENTPAELQANV